MPTRLAARDPELSAVITRRVPLVYADAADDAMDRPAHVRAASGLARIGNALAVVQDDASFVSVIDPATVHCRAIPLPTSPDGVRQFHGPRKKHKLDTECCVSIDMDGETVLFGLGSGSTRRRDRVVEVRFVDGVEVSSRIIQLPDFYDGLRVAAAFAGSELNVEGAVVAGGMLRLFNRGNGSSREDVQPINGICDVALSSFLAHVADPDAVQAPRPANITAYELGDIDGVSLTFTDAAVWRDALVYSAAAEASPNVVDDGSVRGSAIGIIDREGNARWTPVLDEGGGVFRGKIEGVLASAESDDVLLAVIDMDDPATPSELCEVRVRGASGRR